MTYRMDGVWVVYSANEGWGGMDKIFPTQKDAAEYYARPSEDHLDTRRSRNEHIAFVPWGSSGLEEIGI